MSSGMSDSAGGRAGAELMVEQFHVKVLHAVLAVRTPRPLATAGGAGAASFRRRDRWFHLPLHDPPPPREAAERLDALAPGEPLVVDIHLAPAGAGASAVMERWTVACEPWPDAEGEGLAVNRAYKHCFTLLRSVYAVLRLLPAYRVFRLLCANQSYNYEMVYRVGSFTEPFSRAEEAAMRSHRFVPVETQLGRLVVSVQYLSSLADFNLEITSLTPSMLITDYVGSPAAEPMRFFPASLTEATGSDFPPSYHQQRPHSWAPPAFWPHAAAAPQTKFSPPPVIYASPTPSPPNFGGYPQPRLMRGQSAPMCIPQFGERRSPVHRQNTLDPSRGFMLPPPSPRRVGDSRVSGVQESPSESGRLIGRMEGLRMADPYGSSSPRHKGKDSKEESRRFSALSSCDSPWQDDLDDADYPFAVDDVDTPFSQSGSCDGKEVGDQAGSSSHKSQDAQVGSLVHLLRTARPLRDPSYPSQTSGAESSEVASTSSVMSRRASDALEELRSFKEIRERLLSRSTVQQEEPPERL